MFRFRVLTLPTKQFSSHSPSPAWVCKYLCSVLRRLFQECRVSLSVKMDVHCAMLPSPLLWTAKERGDGLTQVDFPKEVSKDDLGMSGCHSCMGRTAEHMAHTLRMWAVPRWELRGTWMSTLGRATCFNRGCVIAPASCRCSGEQGLCAWESPDCSKEHVLA